jgi:hypothetical protein
MLDDGEGIKRKVAHRTKIHKVTIIWLCLLKKGMGKRSSRLLKELSPSVPKALPPSCWKGALKWMTEISEGLQVCSTAERKTLAHMEMGKFPEKDMIRRRELFASVSQTNPKMCAQTVSVYRSRKFREAIVEQKALRSIHTDENFANLGVYLEGYDCGCEGAVSKSLNVSCFLRSCRSEGIGRKQSQAAKRWTDIRG